MRHISLFSGIGGFDLAAEWMGWENVAHCEWNPFGQKVLKYYWPNAISYHDITKTDFTIHRGTIDIITGGFPCQPFSHAGKRKGKEDDRYLWPEMLRVIDEVQPTWVIGENVAGLVSMVQPEIIETYVERQAAIESEDNEETITELQEYVVETICRDLEQIGYSVQPIIIPACATGAPHRRDRIWFIAYSYERAKRSPRESGKSKKERGNDYDEQGERRKQAKQHIGFNNVLRTYTNPHHWLEPKFEERCTIDRGSAPEPRNGFGSCTSGGDFAGDIAEGVQRLERGAGVLHESSSDVANSGHSGLQGSEDNGGIGSLRKNKNKQLAGHVPPNWENFPTQSPIRYGDDGLSARLSGITFPKWRNESIKAGGNAIVPQVAYEIFKAIEQFEQNKY